MRSSDMRELFEHTADLGLRVRAADLDTLFREAAECLFSAVVEDISAIRPNLSVPVSVSASDREFLLFDWLRELLREADEGGLLFGRFDVTVSDDLTATGTAWGEPLDPARHALMREVKAITYHELKVEAVDGGWLAEVIVDI